MFVLLADSASGFWTAGALATAFAAVVAAFVAVRNARRQAEAAERQAQLAAESARESAMSANKQAAQDRFGPWQLEKREVYAEFLAAARPLRLPVSASEAERARFAVEGTRILLYAYADARVVVHRALGEPGLLAQTETWDELVEALRKDVHIKGEPT